MRVLVTGAAGFIGSHLCERLLADGHEVVGVDSFTEFYARGEKQANLAAALGWDRFSFHELDLELAPLEPLVREIDAIVHLAGEPGVRESAGPRAALYRKRNVEVTRRLLEAARGVQLRRFILASSSSVYGQAPVHPTPEGTPLRPLSPYATTKVAAERIARAAHEHHGVPVVALRYFSVYGPRQRPDMAFRRFIDRCLAGRPVEILGDGGQVRDYTYVADAVEATLRALERGRPGAIYNVGGAHPVALHDAIALIAELVPRPVRIERLPALAEEPRSTVSDGRLARRELGFVAHTPLGEGIARQFEWAAERRGEVNPGRRPAGTRRRDVPPVVRTE